MSSTPPVMLPSPTSASSVAVQTTPGAPTAAVPASTVVTIVADAASLPAPPQRDLLDLQRRLRPSPGQPPPGTSLPQATAVAGATSKFWIANQQAKTYFSTDARLAIATDHVYWYLQTGVDVPPSDLQTAATYFESQTYPTEHRLFGSEWMPGIDNDPHLTILIGHIPGVGGYFSTADEYPTVVNAYSNQREMIYINVDAVRPGSGGFNGTVAHEFMHMIQFNVHRNQDSWINEGTAELAAQAVTGAASGAIHAFERFPQTQLNAWASDPADALPHYGAAYLFMRYFAEQFGGFATVGKVVASPGSDVATFAPLLEGLQPPRAFDQVFSDWVAANFLSDPTLGSGKYGYQGLQLHLTAAPGPTEGQTVKGIANQYGATYFHVSADVASQLRFIGSTSVPLIGADPPRAAFEWWSNRGDSIDSRLTRSVDLTTSQHPTLHFSIWYDIEDGFDYGYVEASTDDGHTWSTLATQDTTAANPNGQNYGNGFTGKSGATTSSWKSESADLSQFGGHKILLRFEYVTDDSYNADGFAIDNVSIPEINLRDDGGTDAGWVQEGFVRISNRVRQPYLVEAISTTNGSPVRVLPVATDGSTTLDLKQGESVVLAVAGLVPLSTRQSTFSLSLQPN